MSFKIDTIDNFEKELKRLKKKFPSIPIEIESLIDNLESNPIIGTPIGHGFYKIRLAMASKGRGKRGGGRVITYVKVLDELFSWFRFMTNLNNRIFLSQSCKT